MAERKNKKLKSIEEELHQQALERGLDKDENKASLEKSMRQIADTIKAEGLNP